MSIRIYNTLTGNKEEFKPIVPGKVSMYVCGITAYDECHLGHGRAALVFDVVRNYLEYKGYDVNYVKNFTDIDDKIINRANVEGVSCQEIAEKYILTYKRDMGELGVHEPDHEPKATENMQNIIDMIKRLEKNGFAYEANGDVYFRVERFNGYGKLSGRSLEDMIAGARIEINESKENPMDFALWKKSKELEPSWESPWGRGRPGWHIECSAMSLNLLGETIDIHGGGQDLIFPHHENEIAQSEAFTGSNFVRYWMHNGFVTINEEKMSKSLGNFFTLKDILKRYGAEVVRFFLLSAHYRSPLDFSDKHLDEAEKGLKRINNTMREMRRVVERMDEPKEADADFKQKMAGVRSMFDSAMSDDFNTAQAIGVLFSFVKSINVMLNKPGSNLGNIAMGEQLLVSLGGILGLCSSISVQDVQSSGSSGIDAALEKLMALTVEIRNDARSKKDWAVADLVRDKLAEANIIIQDRGEETTWEMENKLAEEAVVLDKLVCLLVNVRNNARSKKDWAVADFVRDKLAEANILIQDRGEETTWELS